MANQPIDLPAPDVREDWEVSAQKLHDRISAPGETKRERFLRIQQPRVANAIKAIRLLANASRQQNYEWRDSDVALMQGVLYRAVDDVVRAFAHTAAKKTPVTFSFEDADATVEGNEG